MRIKKTQKLKKKRKLMKAWKINDSGVVAIYDPKKKQYMIGLFDGEVTL